MLVSKKRETINELLNRCEEVEEEVEKVHGKQKKIQKIKHIRQVLVTPFACFLDRRHMKGGEAGFWSVEAQREYEELEGLGYTDTEIREMRVDEYDEHKKAKELAKKFKKNKKKLKRADIKKAIKIFKKLKKLGYNEDRIIMMSVDDIKKS